MHVTKKRHVWRTQQVTYCDVYRGKKLLESLEMIGNVGIGRIFNIAYEKYGEDISISNVRKKTMVYVMDMDKFIANADVYEKSETNLK